MAFAVIAIHAPEYLWPEEREHSFLVEWIIRLAVPYFFICSGFLVAKKLSAIESIKAKRNYLRSRACRLFMIWGCWTAVYIPLTFWGLFKNKGSFSEVFATFFKDIFLTDHSIYSQQLWFVYSMAIITLLWSIFNRGTKSVWMLFCTFLAVYILGWLCSQPVIHDVSSWVLGGGVPMIAGALMERFSGCTGVKTIKIRIILLATGSILMSWFRIPGWEIIGGIALFYLSITVSPKLKLGYLAIRKDSMWIYFSHMYVIIFFMILFRRFGIVLPIPVLFIAVCSVSWLCAAGLRSLSNRPKFRFLNELVK